MYTIVPAAWIVSVLVLVFKNMILRWEGEKKASYFKSFSRKTTTTLLFATSAKWSFISAFSSMVCVMVTMLNQELLDVLCCQMSPSCVEKYSTFHYATSALRQGRQDLALLGIKYTGFSINETSPNTLLSYQKRNKENGGQGFHHSLDEDGLNSK